MPGNYPNPHGSTVPRNNISNWKDLPTELLMNIFSHLKLNEIDRHQYEEVKQSLLNIRLLHPRWKLVIDELLEKWCLEYWTEWKAECPGNILNPFGFPILRAGRLAAQNICGPSFFRDLDEFERDPTPPTKHICITRKVESRMLTQGADFSKFGHHLSSLTLYSILAVVTALPAKVLAELLAWMPNLRAIALQYVSIRMKEWELERISLPPLSNLEHLKLWSVEFSFVDWLLKPYKKQLLTLETDHCFEWNPNDGLLAYQNLKRLKVWNPTTRLLKADVKFPSLQCLSLGDLRVGDNGPNTLQLVQKFISHFSSTLVDLHLDISPSIYSRPRTYAAERVGRDEDGAFGPPITNVLFPLLKTFWIFFPKSEEEVLVLNDFLKMFPNLETLKLTLGNTEMDRETARNHLMEQQYWRFCQRLKIITVQSTSSHNDSKCRSLEIDVNVDGPTTLESVQKFISQLSSTLFDLQMHMINSRVLPIPYAIEKSDIESAFRSPITN